jgi:nucleoside-diphosphate-sugar epimerase
VRLLSVAARLLARQTGDMADGAEPTAFVTGAAGFIGRELVKLLVAGGHQVFGLARSPDSAQHVRRAGATAVIGDLLVPGRWQDEAAADWVFHIPPCAMRVRRHQSAKPVARIAHRRAVMDTHLLDAVAAGATRRIVYVADSGCFGPTGARPITEDELPASASRGRCPHSIASRVT